MKPLPQKMIGFLMGCVLAGALAAGPARAEGPALTTLQPGGFREIAQELPVNVVFIGYEPGAGARDIDAARFLAGLPRTGRSVVRVTGAPLGLSFRYDYRVRFADAAFENAFFGHLGSIAEQKFLSFPHEWYNDQRSRSLTIPSMHWISAPAVERWLAEHAGAMLGVDTRQYTLFLINWYGRPDFKFHSYVKLDEPDADTGVNGGLLFGIRKMMAWGGTAPDDPESGLGSVHRIWFHDLSAGPNFLTGSWNLDQADGDFDGRPDFRLPPVWEYGNLNAYRPFNDLTGDLVKLTRYVAIDCLFTASPLYNPALSQPTLPSRIQVDLNVYQAEPGYDAKRNINPALLANLLGALKPLDSFSVEMNDQTYTRHAAKVYEAWLTLWTGDPTLAFGPFNPLVLDHEARQLQFLEGDLDYEVPAFVFATPDALFNQAGISGFASLRQFDYRSGFVFAFDSPLGREIGAGSTSILAHEIGHHLGMAHPHDGYDGEENRRVGPFPTGPFMYAGSECNSVMSYAWVNDDFGQFDRDNMNRWMTSAYVNEANAILGKLWSSPRIGETSSLLESADGAAAAALAAYQAMEYGESAAAAKRAYLGVLAAARQLGVRLEPRAWQGTVRSHCECSDFVDTFSQRIPSVER